MKEFTTGGIIAGAAAWLLIIWYAASQVACAKTGTCKTDDLFIFALISVGMLAPAWVVALITSPLFLRGNG